MRTSSSLSVWKVIVYRNGSQKHDYKLLGSETLTI